MKPLFCPEHVDDVLVFSPTAGDKESYTSDEETQEKRFCFTQNVNFLFTDNKSNGNKTEWSHKSDNKIGRPRSGSPICLSRA